MIALDADPEAVRSYLLAANERIVDVDTVNDYQSYVEHCTVSNYRTRTTLTYVWRCDPAGRPVNRSLTMSGMANDRIVTVHPYWQLFWRNQIFSPGERRYLQLTDHPVNDEYSLIEYQMQSNMGQ